jgi:hypothetical protein
LSSCAIQRYDNEIFVFELTGNTNKINFVEWVSKNSKKSLEMLDGESLLVNQNLGMSMFLVFIDFENLNPEVVKASHEALD